MEIYVVQQGDTIYSIALKFGISVEKLIVDNGIEDPYHLIVGQTLVITYPAQVYTVQEGDTLAGISEAYNVTVLQLLRNNPDLANEQFIYPGETLVISYNNNLGSVWVAGYTYPFINEEILKKTLPCLTYLLIFNYRITDNGELIGSNDDISVIQTANLYGSATTLVVTTYSQTGNIDLEFEYEVLLNQQIQDTIIENLLNILKAKGYNGVNLAFQFINSINQGLYLNFLTNVLSRLHQEGYSVFLTLNPGLKYNGVDITFEKINYTELSNVSDGLLFLSYDWGFTERSPAQFSIITTNELLDYIVTQVPLDKIRIGLPTLGYDWPLPYIPGSTRANALNYDSVLALAYQVNAVINYDESTLSAYFEYIDNLNQPHIVWFKDARSINTSLQILKSYGIEGIGIWNIMYYFSEMWLVLNTQYEIIKV
ncbi:LysM peptidoglycan-binding domain-containing protein [Anaerocolumna sp. MB42-C2]|uniref:LysM peptidoglycan-binding domain-containing protein n=1 Tax=Anaerocolumna sp. MB42-C2 TaxID=3070997 RepID=UPI0027DEE1D8|nr:LysM peptidoglycan-binding domain-containing protein [Anaerocolumna sp. MB42-C2]WMJ86361.1 LysM peptidoglycan-binding domain-containing protein [Anaerocolumna sp. MB42-C2]